MTIPASNKAIGDPGHTTDHNSIASTLTRSYTGVENVVGSGATGDGSTDDTSAIQSALTAARNAGGGVVVFPPGTYRVTSALIVGSNTTILADDATINLDGSTGRLLETHLYDDTSARLTDVAVIGGHWTRDATVANTHLLAFHKVDGLTVRDVRLTTEHGKFALSLSDVTKFTVANVNLDVYSDGVHVQGPALKGSISGIFGTTGDDSVAVGCRDYASQEIGSPADRNIRDIVIRDVFTTSTRSVVHLFAGASATMRNVSVSGIRGTTTTGALASVSDDTNDANTTGNDVGGVSIRDVAGSVPDGYPAVGIAGADVRDVLVDGVAIEQDTACYGVELYGTVVAETVVVRNITVSTTGNVVAVGVLAGATITDLVVDGVVGTWNSSNASGRVMTLAAAPTRLSMSNIHQTGGQATVYHQNAAATIVGSNWRLNDAGGGVWATSTTVLTVSIDGFDAQNGTTGLQMTGGSGCGIVAKGNILATGSVYKSGSQTLRVNSPGASVDLSKVNAAVAGDLAINSNGVLSCGTGLCLYTGAAWKNIDTAATY